MHEVGLMTEVVDAALDEAARAGASRIHRIALCVGRLAGVEPEALPLAFEAACAGTAAEGAALEVEIVPVVCACPGCHSEFTPDGMIFACPKCNALTAEVRQGRDLVISAVEVS